MLCISIYKNINTGGFELKTIFICFSVPIMLYGILSYIAVIINKPILCANLSMSLSIIGVALTNNARTGIGLELNLIIFLTLLIFNAILFMLVGLRYNAKTDIDIYRKELEALGFTSEEYIYNNKIHKFIAPNGTKVIVKQHSHNKFTDIYIVNWLRISKIKEVRKELLPLIKKNTVLTNVKRDSIILILIGLVFFGIYFIL